MIDRNDTSRLHFAVIVLGDVGRSPRMQYHTRSLLEQGHYVSLVGYTGEDLIPDLNELEAVKSSEGENLLHVVRFKPYTPPAWLRKYKVRGKVPIGLPIYLLLRLVGLLGGLIYALWFRVTKRKNHKSKPAFIPIDCILIQNPPSIPLILISYLYCITHTKLSFSRSSSSSQRTITSSRPGLVIDWHNLGYTMFDTPTPHHPIRTIAKYYEAKLAPLSDGNLCVTSAMRDYLVSDFKIQTNKIQVLQDRPPEFFHSTSLQVKHELMMKLRDDMELSCPVLKQMRLDAASTSSDGDGHKHEYEEMTIFTKCSYVNGSKKVIPQDNQPALLISSTSWTPDEDFSILLNALVEFNHKRKKQKEEQNEEKSSLPHVVVIVTGKGPQKAMYQSKIAKLKLEHVSIITMWLEAKDYPLLLGCSDLGISLHVSTSGFDLPMKIYDFFGCEVPVCAVSFKCLDELVQDGANGRVFHSSDELANQLFDLLDGMERSGDNAKLNGELKTFRSNIRGISRWRENWIENAYDIILAACPDRDSSRSKKID